MGKQLKVHFWNCACAIRKYQSVMLARRNHKEAQMRHLTLNKAHLPVDRDFIGEFSEHDQWLVSIGCKQKTATDYKL